MNVGCYCRVSTTEQAMNGHSLEEQTDRMQKYCEAMRWSVYRVYTDAGQSGASMNRPALQQMIRDIQSRKIEKVLVYKLDRISRSQKDTLHLIEDIFLANNVEFVSMSENFDTSSPFGRAMIGILSVFAQLEREQIRERMTMGKEARAKEGKFFGGRFLPIGYAYNENVLTVDEYEAMQVREIFDRAERGESLFTIAQDLNRRGLNHKNGPWYHQTVRRVLNSRIYTGYISYSGEWFKGNHEAIITEEQFSRVEKILSERTRQHKEHNRRIGKANTLLGGFLVCAQCGAKYSKFSEKRHRKDGSLRYREYYQCNSQSKRTAAQVKDPNCRNQKWDIEDLTAQVLGEIRKLAIDPAYLESARSSGESENRPEVISAEIAKIENQINRLLDLYSMDNIPAAAVQARINDLADQRERLEAEREAAENEKNDRITHEEIVKVIQSFEDVLARADFDETRMIIGELIDYIELDGSDVRIHWSFC